MAVRVLRDDPETPPEFRPTGNRCVLQ